MDHLHQYVPTVTSEYIYEDEDSGTQNKVSRDHFHYLLIGKYMIYISTISMSYMKCILYTKICVGALIHVFRSFGSGYTAVHQPMMEAHFQLRNLINRRNVIKKPKNAVAQCEEFFLLVVKAHIVCAAMTLFGMIAVDSDPAVSDIFPSGCEELEPEQRINVLVMATENCRQVRQHFFT